MQFEPKKMKMSDFQWKSCARKCRYKTEKNAANALRAIKKTGKIVENANAYHCEFCKGWHIGHKMKDS